MGDKISQYTADGTSNPLKDEDLFDASNEDGAGSFDLSKKITALELLAYINANVDNLYSTDGSIPNNREVVLNSKILSFIQGDIKLKSTGGNVNFVLESSVANKRVNLKHNDSLDSGEITLSNSAGDFFTSSDGETRTERLSASYSGVMGNYSMIVKGLNSGSTNILAIEANNLSGKIDFGTILDNPNISMFDKNGTQQVNINSGGSSCWFLRPVGINMTGGTARLSIKALSTATNRVSRIRNSSDSQDLWHVLDNGVMGAKEFTVGALPPALDIDGAYGIIIVADETGGRTLATSDGTDWRRVSDGAIVS